MMFGYACDETHGADADADRLRAPAGQAPRRRCARRACSTSRAPTARPRSRCATRTIARVGIDAVVVSTQHSEDVKYKTLKEAIIEEVIKKELPKELLAKTKFFINPTGRFVVGGPMGDSGLTGRKIIVDTYGGMGRHGGGAFSGKDPSKVDRSACYYARYIAKNVVAAKLARRCEVQVAYAIGVAEPVSLLRAHLRHRHDLARSAIERLIREHFDCRPGALIRELDLLRPIYRQTAAYGHFGRSEKEFTWEQTNKAAALAADARSIQPVRTSANGNGHSNGNGHGKTPAPAKKPARKSFGGSSSSAN